MGAITAIIGAAQQQIDAQRSAFQKAGDYRAQAGDLEYQAEVAGMNSELARYQSQIAESDDYLKNYRAMGRQAAAQAQGGVLGSVTGQGLLTESENEASKSGRRIRLMGELASAPLLAESIGLRGQASEMKRNARIALFEGIMGPFAQPVMDHMNVFRAIGK
jgi:hypothetical protein